MQCDKFRDEHVHSVLFKFSFVFYAKEIESYKDIYSIEFILILGKMLNFAKF